MSIKPIKPLSTDVENQVVTETPEEINTSETPLSTTDLLKIIADLSRQNTEANKQLAAAIIKTTEPREYKKTTKELAEEANNKLFDERAKELSRRQKLTVKLEQDACDHIAGGSQLSEQRDIAGRTSIIWHRNDVGVDIGLCTVCQRPFRPSDQPDEQGHTYAYWRKKPSFNKLSAAGFRTILNPVQAQAESYLHDS
jgi:hypothetical protein